MNSRARLAASVSVVVALVPTIASTGQPRTEAGVATTVKIFLQATAARDVATAERLFADEALFVDAAGRVATKAQFLTRMRGAARPTDDAMAGEATIDQEAARVYGDAAVMNLRLTRKDADGSSRAERVTAVLYREGSWRVVAGQSSPVEGAAQELPTLVAGAIDSGRSRTAATAALAQLPRLITRLFASGDDTGYERLLGDEFVRIGPDGSMLAKLPSARRFGVNTSNPVAPSDVSGVRVRRYGNLGVVTNEESRVGADGRRNPSRFLRVFIQRAGTWLLILAHQTMTIPVA